MSELTKLTPRLHVRDHGPDKQSYIFFCPGCGCGHNFPVGKAWGREIGWTFNGNIVSPSFTPSLRLFTTEGTVCHLVLTDGKINYCTDCRHAMAGKTVEMVDIPGNYGT